MENIGPAWRHTNLFSQDGRRLHRPSLVAVVLDCCRDEVHLEQASGFIVEQDGRHVLVTNRHVLSGVNPDGSNRNGPSVVPNRADVRLWHRSTETRLQSQAIQSLSLRDDSECALWQDHSMGREVDVAAIEIFPPENSVLATIDPGLPVSHLPGVCDDVYVVGFPFGVSAEGLAVWTRAVIATEYEYDYNSQPRYLVDGRTRPGQSGSPVFVYRVGAYTDRFGGLSLPNTTAENLPTDGMLPTTEHLEKIEEHFIGIYSGRVNDEADIGFVWRPQVVADVVRLCLAGDADGRRT